MKVAWLVLLIVASATSALLAPIVMVLCRSYKEERLRVVGNRQAELEPVLEPVTATQLPIYYTPSPVKESFNSESFQSTPELTTNNSPNELVWQFITTHEEGWLVDILERPILIWGAQGSYKSYLAAYLAMLRIMLKGHQIEINDPHLEMNRKKAWKPLLEAGIPAYGSKFDYVAIAQRIDAFIVRLKNATDSKEWVSPVFDEVTQYSLEPDIKDVASKLLIKCLSDCRKGKEAPILLAHNNTQSMLGGATGIHQAKEEGLVQLHLLSTSRSGEYHPLFRGELTGIPNARGKFVTREITINPEVMNADYLVKLFAKQPVTMPDSVSPELETVNLKVSDTLGEPLKTVWLYAKKRSEFIKASEVQRDNSILKSVPTVKIRQYFGLLFDMGYGELLGEGDRLTFRAY